MSYVVDTNVVAYYLMGAGDFADESRTLWRSTQELLAPSSWEAELANVIWMAVRNGSIDETEGSIKLELAARLGIHSVVARTLWQGALTRAVASGVPVYDTLFVELADREQVPLVTFDRKLLAAYPTVAKRPKDLRAQAT
jgi:predicted nucleic acid-binding protein